MEGRVINLKLDKVDWASSSRPRSSSTLGRAVTARISAGPAKDLQP